MQGNMKITITKANMEEIIEQNIDFLGDYFVNLLEVGGIAITKDNYEPMFDNWLEDLTEEELTKIINKNQ